MAGISETIVAWGHPSVSATHRTTLEFTKEDHLTMRGDCIVAVKADKGLCELDSELKEALRTDGARVELIIDSGTEQEFVHGFGSSSLILAHPTDFVVRKSRYICERTLMIMADKAACDLPRSMVKALRQPGNQCRFTIKV